jgi:hypothetical protein
MEISCVVCDALSNNELGTLHILYKKFQEACKNAAEGKSTSDDMWLAREKIDCAYPGPNTSISTIRNNVVIFVPRWIEYDDGKHCVVRVECEFDTMIRCGIDSFLVQRTGNGLYKSLDRMMSVFRGDIQFLYSKIRVFRYEVDSRYSMISAGLREGNPEDLPPSMESPEPEDEEEE